MSNVYRTQNCGELNIQNVGQEVKLAGWIQRIRNLGGMTFIDLRDQYGITQIVVASEELKAQIANLCTECVISVEGTVVERSNKNAKIPTDRKSVGRERV